MTPPPFDLDNFFVPVPRTRAGYWHRAAYAADDCGRAYANGLSDARRIRANLESLGADGFAALDDFVLSLGGGLGVDPRDPTDSHDLDAGTDDDARAGALGVAVLALAMSDPLLGDLARADALDARAEALAAADAAPAPPDFARLNRARHWSALEGAFGRHAADIARRRRGVLEAIAERLDLDDDDIAAARTLAQDRHDAYLASLPERDRIAD